MAVINELSVSAELVLSPSGLLYLDESSQTKEQLSRSEFEKIRNSFSKGSPIGLLYLGVYEFGSFLPPSFLFWQIFSRYFITELCKLPNITTGKELPHIPEPGKIELEKILNQALLIRGGEYLTADVLIKHWNDLLDALRSELQDFPGNIQEFLNSYNSRWNFVGRVCFHLAENKNNSDRPFAFLATYTTQLSQQNSAKHIPLKHALQDYANEKKQGTLLALLLPVQKAASQSNFIKKLVDSGNVFQAQTWNVHEAHQFLKEIPLMESSGIMVRVPNWWSSQKPIRPKVVVKLGEQSTSTMGLSALVDFDVHFALSNGEPLSEAEWHSILNATENLIKIKGQWVEIDRKKLDNVLSHWTHFKNAYKDGVPMGECLRLLAGKGLDILQENNQKEQNVTVEWSSITAGNWLRETLDALRNPSSSSDKIVEKTLNQHLKAVLRPYQLSGVQWLWLLYQLKLGGCLADDMGLGKTIQVLSLLLMIKHHRKIGGTRKPHLLVVPASLLGNWQSEAVRFAPTLKMLVAHSSSMNRDLINTVSREQLTSIDIVMTTYGCLSKLSWLTEVDWDLLILDEAQLIKNPNTKQSRLAKTLKSEVRFTLTGTPIENRLTDLWSIFDFTSPGLLGSGKVFSAYAKKVGKNNSPENHSHFVSTLRRLTQPYILRRLKTDKKVISDLPNKTEMQTYCLLSKEQIRLYQQGIKELTEELKGLWGIQRRGLILTYFLRFKQICNHPDQWLGYGNYAETLSGKFIRLKEICQEIASKQEKVLVFTQFREIIPSLASLLSQIFGREGLTLDGDTSIKQRAHIVERFQQELGPPFIVLSLKAGGVGLNLTRASHVIHFDRWWNPAIENQATDRAFRIGQQNPVFVHKFICRGTIEEHIDLLITSKKNLSQELLETDNELLLTELTNEELLDIVSLDIQQAMNDH